ncbi:hypothetical protein T484DRAFT_1863164 [Baffinella frigidus]|nr:hypothetical protein T484DRAFT_1863164 [Cryptophyta sp. CCMP2293]
MLEGLGAVTASIGSFCGVASMREGSVPAAASIGIFRGAASMRESSAPVIVSNGLFASALGVKHADVAFRKGLNGSGLPRSICAGPRPTVVSGGDTTVLIGDGLPRSICAGPRPTVVSGGNTTVFIGNGLPRSICAGPRLTVVSGGDTTVLIGNGLPRSICAGPRLVVAEATAGVAQSPAALGTGVREGMHPGATGALGRSRAVGICSESRIQLPVGVRSARRCAVAQCQDPVSSTC